MGAPVTQRPAQRPRAGAGFARACYGERVAAAIVLFVTLVAGIAGFRHVAGMDWPTAFHEAALLLSGMGPQES